MTFQMFRSSSTKRGNDICDSQRDKTDVRLRLAAQNWFQPQLTEKYMFADATDVCPAQMESSQAPPSHLPSHHSPLRPRTVLPRLSRLIISALVVKTFKNSTAERVPSEWSKLRYTSDILEYLFKSTAERVQLGLIDLRYISLALQSFLLSCQSCRG